MALLSNTWINKTANIGLLLLVFQTSISYGQNDTIKNLSFSGYGELYYSYDFSNPQNHEKPDFIYNHKRHNELNVNLLLVKSAYHDNRVRANLGLMAGNYPHYNLSSEPQWAKFIYEANLGVKLSRKNNIWLDAGIMPSHIGFESAISADCWTITRSILAENSPYFETGIKLGYTNKKENLNLAFLVLNGWQKINKPDNFQRPSFGMQINYTVNEKILLNYSNFIGTDKPDSLNTIRLFHNFYLQYNPSNKIGFIAGFDLGTDKYDASNYGVWYSPIIIIKYEISSKIKMAIRGEYYNDNNQIIVTTNTPNGFRIFGLSSNFDYKINDKAQFRIEGKILNSKDVIFQNKDNKNYSITTNLSIRI